MASPRRTFKDIESSSPYKKRIVNLTPSKRARFQDMFSTSNKGFHNLEKNISSVKESFANYTAAFVKVDSALLLSGLVCSYGFEITCRLLAAIAHVPKGFRERQEYILKIVNYDCDHFHITDLNKLIPSLEDMAQKSTYTLSDDLLWKCTKKYKEGFLVFLLPPVKECVMCGGTLYSWNVVQTTCFTMHGPKPGLKTTFRCKKGCGTCYNIDRYVIQGQTKFYKLFVPVVSASNCAYMTREVHELMCESANHAFVSHHAFTEIYNSLFHSSLNGQAYKRWLTSNDRNGKYDDKDQPHLLSRKKSLNFYINGEILNEVYERNDEELIIAKNETREDLLTKIDCLRREEIYEHGSCSQTCKEKGCESLRVIDACWKVCMPHCMFATEMEVKGMPLLNFPNVCTKEPKSNSVFCKAHHEFLERNGIPTEKAKYLKYIGCKENPSSPSDIELVDTGTVQLSRQMKEKSRSTIGCNAAEFQGTADMIDKIEPSKWEAGNNCNKNTGQKSQLRQRSRGHFICVTGGGHIQYFAPLFKSESPSQIFMLVLRVMIMEFSQLDEDEVEAAMEKYVLAYDNMCQLNSLRAAKEPLPFPAPYDKMWEKVLKIIDRLHLRNHKSLKFHEEYNPNQIPDSHNTMVAEQTFSWLSRFKKNVNSMSQPHHLFYVHRNIIRCNLYSERCRKDGKTPLLPGINIKTYTKS